MATSGDGTTQNPVHPANPLPHEGGPGLPDVVGGQQLDVVANMPDVVSKLDKSDDPANTKKHGCIHYERRCAYVVSIMTYFLLLSLAFHPFIFLFLAFDDDEEDDDN